MIRTLNDLCNAFENVFLEGLKSCVSPIQKISVSRSFEKKKDLMNMNSKLHETCLKAHATQICHQVSSGILRYRAPFLNLKKMMF